MNKDRRPFIEEVPGGYAADTPTVVLPREQVERVLRVLEAVKRYVDGGEPPCIFCGMEGEHVPGCSLAASIADLKALGL